MFESIWLNKIKKLIRLIIFLGLVVMVTRLVVMVSFSKILNISYDDIFDY